MPFIAVNNKGLEVKNITKSYSKKKILDNEDIFGRGNKLEKVDIDNSFPAYITRNKDKFSDWII